MLNVSFEALLLMLGSLQVVRVAAISLTVNPRHLIVTTDLQSVSFTCTADVALARCQFRWWDGRLNEAGPLLDLSKGTQSQADPAHLNTNTLINYSYSGLGLGSGDCGVSLEVKDRKEWMVTCRVRAETGGWKYAWADLFASEWSPLPLNLTTPRELVVLPGGEARFSLETQEPLVSCRFLLPGESSKIVFFLLGAESPDSTGRHLYLGAGMQSGQCGLALTNVSEADNGRGRCWMSTPSDKADIRMMTLIVAYPPTAPTLNLAYTDSNVTATCEVKESRPVATISWVLGDDIIRQDEDDDSQAGPQDEWRWPWMQGSIKQTLTLQLQPQHNGKDLTCRVSHFALAQPLEAKMTILPAAAILPQRPKPLPTQQQGPQSGQG